MCEFGEIWSSGMMPKRFVSRMKQNSVVKYGANRTPRVPDHVPAMLFADEAVDRLGDPLLLGRHQLRLPVGQQEEDDDQRDREPDQQR